MSSTVSFPIEYILDLHVDANTGRSSRELKECVTCYSSLIITEDGVRLVPYWGINLANGGLYELFICDSQKDSFYQDRVTFTGFHSTALAVLAMLGVPADEYEFVV